MPDWVLPTDATGVFHGEGLMPIDAVHRQGVPHRGVWLHVLTRTDGHLLLVRRSLRMATCPDSLSIIGEHHAGREEDEACAYRAIREEVPGLAPLVGTRRLQLSRLRQTPRWFLFDYPTSAKDGARRYECAPASSRPRVPCLLLMPRVSALVLASAAASFPNTSFKWRRMHPRL